MEELVEELAEDDETLFASTPKPGSNFLTDLIEEPSPQTTNFLAPSPVEPPIEPPVEPPPEFRTPPLGFFRAAERILGRQVARVGEQPLDLPVTDAFRRQEVEAQRKADLGSAYRPLTDAQWERRSKSPIQVIQEGIVGQAEAIESLIEIPVAIVTAPFRRDGFPSRAKNPIDAILQTYQGYKEWEDPGVSFRVSTGIPTEKPGELKVGIKGILETALILTVPIGKGPQAAKLLEQALVKKSLGQALTKAELSLVGRAEAQATKLAKEAPVLTRVEQMWQSEVAKSVGQPNERAFELWLKAEEKLLDKFAGINKVTARSRNLWAKTHPNEPFPIQLDAELHAANLGGAADAGIQRAIDAYNPAMKLLGKDIPSTYLDSYLHLKHNLDVLKLKPGRKVAGGLGGVKELNAGLKELEAVLGKERFARLELSASEITEFYASYLQRGVDSGLVSKELAAVLRAKYPNYNPIQYLSRIAEGVEAKGAGKAMSVTKNDLKLLSEMGNVAARERPLNTMARLAIQKETLIRRNDAARAISRLVENDVWIQDQLARLPASQKGTISFMEEGVKKTIDVPRWLEREAKLLGNLGVTDLERVGQVLNAASRFGMTTANLAFFVPNMAVDSLTSMLTYGVGAPRLVRRLALNLKDIIREDATLAAMRRSGGSMSGFWGKTPEEIAREAAKKGQLVLDRGWDAKRIVGAPFEAITKIGHAIEMAPRSAVFELELERGKLLEQAALAARRSTIDFQRSGTAIRQANALFLYLNAGVQGSMIPLRALRDQPRSRYFLAGYMSTVMGTYAWNRQFPEYEDIPDYVKYGSLPVMLPSNEYDKRGNKVPHYITVIPNLREWSLFSGPMIYAMRKLDQKNTGDFDRFIENWAPSLNPVSQIIGTGGLPVPTQIGQTLTELALNRDTFRNRDIVPEELLNEPAAEQFDQWTTLTARKVGETLGFSPMKIDFLVKNILGGLGTQFLSSMDAIIRGIEGEGGDENIQLLLNQLQSIQETSQPDDIAPNRRDFLEALSPKDREAVLKLELKPDKRIPIISNIVGRIFRDRGGEIYQIAKEQAREALENDTSLQTADEEFSSNTLQNVLNLQNAVITPTVFSNILRDDRLFHRGRKSEAWHQRELTGAIASADVQEFLPPEYKQGAEDRALDEYYMTIDRLFTTLRGAETDENVSNVWKQVDAYINGLSPEIRDYVLRHKNDWINDMPPEAQPALQMRVTDMDYIGTTGYWELSTMVEQRAAGFTAVDHKGNMRFSDPVLDASLAFWFDYIFQVKTSQAQQILAQKVDSLGIPRRYIPALINPPKPPRQTTTTTPRATPIPPRIPPPVSGGSNFLK